MCRPFPIPHHPVMTTCPQYCIIGENDVSLSISAASEVSKIYASIIYDLNIPCIFDQTGLQRSYVDIKVPTSSGFYTSRMNLVVSYGLPSAVLLGSDWILPCQPSLLTTTRSYLTLDSRFSRHSPLPIFGNGPTVRSSAFKRDLSDISFSHR